MENNFKHFNFDFANLEKRHAYINFVLILSECVLIELFYFLDN